ncbi:GNAT family N-acetyltransferase [Bacillus pseudomycoides]|uniref:GNAT family N-acetyltransferase n=1 Tax=Bacillus pseudomycoides TaxID=64104 RepID=UPI000BED3EFF|nr:GNAT family N-acetyltransferase [Bacillus pseudomycoides]PEE37779.1 GNAT family N-acetyltransferase [Bacillus pseudomycoides]PEK62639.1 GNAT family N-acetyltransferase [Bacillus pseudomycoides]PGA83257.1 GNAT family N-acetyltransferase [Bacillus pseudomycoides]PGE88212.1 GNAT family N-acetyltransferase [Bacillus pseudomycoides]PHF51537.1 GNAT family N-acetyltransferase [Bacillus pseudomycoides]
MIYRKANQKDYATILNIWEESVLATHHFLTDTDREEIKKEIPSYFQHINIQLWYKKEDLIGFSAVNKQHLEMLFLKPNKTGKGYGKAIIYSLIKDFDIKTVDVNKDNKSATKFYINNGFFIVSETETDSSGRPYPILQLKLK